MAEDRSWEAHGFLEVPTSVRDREVVATSTALALIVFLTTNTVDITRFAWDNTFYRAMAESWLAPHSLTAPFAYRLGGPLLARILSDVTGMPLEHAFRALAWAGCALQLVVVWHFVRLLTHSKRAAWVGWAVTAASFWNVKFLAFYVYSTDNLAYPLVFGALLAAICRRWVTLIVLALSGALFREFSVIPPLAAVASMVSLREWATLKRWGGALIGATSIAVIAPRVFLTVSSSTASVSMGHPVQDVAHLVLDWERDINLILAAVFIALPVAALCTKRSALIRHSPWVNHILRWYTAGVLALAMIGGSDLGRFLSYLIPVAALLAGQLAASASIAAVVTVIAVTAWFNRIAEPIPGVSIADYLDHYGVFHNRINAATLSRITWWLACAVLGRTATRLMPRSAPQ